MNPSITNPEFENIANKWKQIFANFIEIIIDENDNIYEQSIFKFLRNSNADPSIWSTLFLENLVTTLLYELYDLDYSQLLLKNIFTIFNDLESRPTQIEPIKQYLKFLCVERGLKENYYNNIDEDTDIMDDDGKTRFFTALFICTAIQFAHLHQHLIQDIITNNLTPNTYLK